MNGKSTILRVFASCCVLFFLVSAVVIFGCGHSDTTEPSGTDQPVDPSDVRETMEIVEPPSEQPTAEKAQKGFASIPAVQVDVAQKDFAEKAATTAFTAWTKGSFEPLGDNFSKQMQITMPPVMQKQSWAVIEGEFGGFQSVSFHEALKSTAGPAHVIYRFKGTFSKAAKSPEVRVVVDDAGKVGGFFVLQWFDDVGGAAKAGTDAVKQAQGAFEVIAPDQLDAGQRGLAEKMASATLLGWTKGRFEKLGDEWSSQVQATLTPDMQKSSYPSIEGLFGTFKSLSFHEARRPTEGPKIVVYRFKGTFSKAAEPPEVRVTVDESGTIAGFVVRPWGDQFP